MLLVLGKRKATRYVLHSSDISASPRPEPSTSTANLTVYDTPAEPSSKKARHPCTYSGYTKSYSKVAHAKSHLPESEHPYVCNNLTFRHLHCTVEGCNEVFAKHHQLRSRTYQAHALPPGTKFYTCTHPGCTKFFNTSHKLKSHVKTHDDSYTFWVHKRCTCARPNCLPSSNTDSTYYPIWISSRLIYARPTQGHPPTCMHFSCNRQIFASQHNLRAHQKLHEQQELEAVLADVEPSEATDLPRKRRRGGEVGRDWKCDKCRKEFKSMKALTTHNVIHLGHRNHVCPHQHYSSAFSYKKLLDRHLAKIHSARSDQSVADPSESDGATTTDADTDCPDNESADSIAHLSIDRITEHAYSPRSRMPTSKTIWCPYPNVEDLLLLPLEIPLSGSSAHCHRILTYKSKVDSWVRSHRGSARRS
ncbi:hypothetical protein DFJ58DRAFT_756375 [Suillus subalutaceus]|uniref:uncharacterized protein n=1 Tax=Suillus subalutaceus TaxID=48586 RepID=UPI001B87DAD6|nr:uncharacterized protein DFJ58DRAFT_756375 [Suillus subalutaceus]KAG1875449.1 hypothetical protein DFJ58DRAFT_756375 [Suillus subalutaceus]